MHAVLTGDIVGSSGLSPEEHRTVVEIIKSIADVFPDTVVGAVDVYSGDGWQMLLSDCGMSFRIALYLRAGLKREKAVSVDSRVSIAWGEVDARQVNMQRISESTGEVFTASGRGLKELKKPSLMCFIALSDNLLSVAGNGVLRLMDALVRQWSPEQARAVGPSLLGRTQLEISQELDVGQSSINKSLQAASWPDIDALLVQFEAFFGNYPAGQ
jgi:hypothetical protein